MSAIGPKRTSQVAPHMSAFGGIADMTLCGNPLLRSLLGVKRTLPFALHMSACDPKRTSASAFFARPRPHPFVSETRWLRTVFFLIRRFAPPESVVHADQGSSRGRLGAEGTTSRTG